MTTLQDAAIVPWPAGKKKPKTKWLAHLPGAATNLSKEQEDPLRAAFADD